MLLNNKVPTIFRYSREYNRHTFARIIRSFSGGNYSDVDLFLETRGYTGPMKEGILKAFPSKPTIRELETLGPSGLQELARSVRRDVDRRSGERNIAVHISVPHHHTEFSVKGREGDSFFDLALENVDLKSYLECSCGGIAGSSHDIISLRFPVPYRLLNTNMFE